MTKENEITPCLLGGRDPKRKLCVVRAIKESPWKEEVLVGVSIALVKPVARNLFKWTKPNSKALLSPAKFEGKENQRIDPPVDFISCMLSCMCAVENFRDKCDCQFDCQFTLLKGNGLSNNWTVGFCYATHKALCEVIGPCSNVESDANTKWTLNVVRNNAQ